MSVSELTAALDDVLRPSNVGMPTRCPAVDADANGDYGVEDLIRGATARGVGCTRVVSPAGWRGAAVDGVTGELLTGATVSSNPWPLPNPTAQHPTWARPRSGSGTPTPTPQWQIQSSLGSPPLMRPGLPPPNVAFDPPAAACLPGTSSTPAPSPGWQRVRVEKPGYAPRVFYRPLEFAEREMSFSTPACTEGIVRRAETSVWPLYPEGTTPSEGLLPDIALDERQMVIDRQHVCVNMPDGWLSMRVLQVGIATPNAGLGDLRLEGRNVADCGESNDVMEQIVSLDATGNRERRRQLPPGSIEPHLAHGHFHLRDWARFRLLRPTPGVCDNVKSRPQSCVVRESKKLSFCIIDSQLFDGAIGPSDRRFPHCEMQADGVVRMGIQRGWSDVYGSGLFGQLIETTGLSGTYWLEAEANLGGAVEEVDSGNNIVRVPVRFSTPQACVLDAGQYRCAHPALGECSDLDCRVTSPVEGCSLSANGQDCQLCKDSFCLRDQASEACLGPCGVNCPPETDCRSVPVTACPTNSPTRTPTARTPTPTRTPTRTPTPTGPTRTPTSTPPTPRLPGLAVLIPDVEGQPGQRVPLDVHLTGSAGIVGGLQLDLLLPQAAVASLDLSETASDCELTAAFTATHRMHAAHAPDRAVAGFDRVRLLVVDHNVTQDHYTTTDTLSDGVVVRCWLTILSNAQRGSYPLRIDRPRAGDVRGTSLWPFPGRSTLYVGGCTGSCC